ncbi:G-protein coupled receptor 83-like [Macrotis lagotis]|uniref:G-protein coupled receptor 83-like n=1 Tax=Macrotis lagotis TaxID=92651 RepID=UPI003D697A3C
MASFQLPGSIKSLFMFAYFFITCVSFIGNLMVCIMILKHKRAHSASGIFTINLALANFLITLLNTPFALVSFINNTWMYGHMICYLSRFVQFCSVYVSMLTLGALSLDRYRVTLQPQKPRMNTVKGSICVIIIWIQASCFSLPHSMYQKISQLDVVNKTNRMICLPSVPGPSDVIRKYLDLTLFILLYILPFLVTVVTCSIMAKKILLLRNPIQDERIDFSFNHQQKKKVILKMLIMVVLVFYICWSPLYFYEVLLSSSAIYNHEAVYFALHWFAMSSTCYNPIIYYLLNKAFRDEVKIALRSWWQKVFNRNHTRPTVSAIFCQNLRESYPPQEVGFGMCEDIDEIASQYDQIDPSNVRIIIGMP